MRILILTPTLGTRSTLSRTIQSVREIGKDKVRHIVIAPQDKIAELQNKFPNVEFETETNRAKGIYPQLNDGFFKYGRDCDYLGWINDDDWWLPDFEKLIEAAEKNLDLDIVYGNSILYKNDKILKKYPTLRWFNLFYILFQSGIAMLTQQSTLLKSDRFFEIGGLSEKYKLVSDAKLWIDLCRLKPKFKYINSDCATFSLDDGRLSSDKNRGKEEIEFLNKEYPSVNPVIKIFARKLFKIANPSFFKKIKRN
jgi:hypothetical protein